jgi:predicted phage baseplate assembly protein
LVVIDFSGVGKESSTNRIRPLTEKNDPSHTILITNARDVRVGGTRSEYGVTGKTTQIELSNEWLTINTKADAEPQESIKAPTPNDQEMSNREFQIIRHTVVYAQSEELPLAEEPIESLICGVDDFIELDAVYGDLQTGRQVIIAGERWIVGTSGVRGSELVTVAEVTHGVTDGLPGDKRHTSIKLAQRFAGCYKRDSVTLYGNVVKATHGETRNEVLGNGDAAKALQQFTLKQPPLTYVSAPTVDGISSTLEVRVNGVQWDEIDSLAGLSPKDRNFIVRTDDDAKTTIVFGNGREGARLPTGVENVVATYRNGIGKGGNATAEQISLPATRPLGVKGVINPLRAAGGADKETRDQARRNAPLAVMALDRLVSTQDYADFARTFAGIAKASATRLPDGHRQLVHITIAGIDDSPIDETSDLYQNLRRAVHQFGDPHQAIQIAVRELTALVLSANVSVSPRYLWNDVQRQICDALFAKFGFDQRELGQPVHLSEVISAIQAVDGVVFVGCRYAGHHFRERSRPSRTIGSEAQSSG